jgi:hypothetical protein
MNIKRATFLIGLIFLTTSAVVVAQVNNTPACKYQNQAGAAAQFKKTTATSTERGLGLQDKGQVSNYLGNYGVLSNYLEYFNDAIHWPASANTERQYCFGLGLVVASKGNVITSVLGGISQKPDWSPKVGSRGKLFSGDVKVTSTDETPILASSDNSRTWATGYYDEDKNWVSTPSVHHWPGHFRIDIDSTSPTFGKEIADEFVSDRDIYSVFDDDNNSSSQGSLGIEVEQTGYSYGRPYAENFLIWDYTIKNKSSKVIDSAYIGYYAIFRPDYDNQDYVNFIKATPKSASKDLVYIYDVNNTRDGAWASDNTPMGMVGLKILNTSGGLGVTDFHYFTRDVAPQLDQVLWPIISSNKKDANIALPEAFFHGADNRIDDTSPDSLKVYFPNGAPINYLIFTGPVTLQPGDSVHSSVAVVMGYSGTVANKPDTSDLMKNVRIVQQMYERKYQGSGPPKTPKVTATSGSNTVKLSWDSEAESSVDVLTGKTDFEGYKVYRSDDQGKTWGTSVTDLDGNVIGYKPLKIYDLVDGIKGQDPAFNQSLGTDSGIKHSYTDSTVINGINYWYCVTAYDKGNQVSDSLEQSYQSPLGKSLLQSNTVSVIPGVKAQNYVAPEYSPVSGTTGSIPPTGGLSDGVVKLDIVQPEKITGDNYFISFVDSAKYVASSKTTYSLGFNLYRLSASTGDTTLLLEKHTFSDSTGDNLPIVDGFRLTVQNSATGIKSIGWTKVNGDTSNFDWRTAAVSKYLSLGKQVVQENVYTFDDIRLTIDTTASGGTTAHWYDYFTNKNIDTLQHLPFKVEIVTDTTNPVDISNTTWLYEFATKASWDSYRQYYYSPLGWDLVPGGKGYTPGSSGYYEKYVDVLVLEQVTVNAATKDTVHNGLWLQTNNRPDTYITADGDTVHQTAIAPHNGDQFTIRTYKPFRKTLAYNFSTKKESTAVKQNIDLAKIRVVPDPYVVASAYETDQYGKKLMFTNLPKECKISIFTVAGDHVADVYHDDATGYQFWDMRTYNGQYIAYGLYVYIVNIPSGQKKVGRFLVIK